VKAHAFPKLDRPPRRARTAAERPETNVNKATWISWRMKLGASHKGALKLWDQYQEWRAQEALNPRVRVLTVQPWQNWEREFRAFLDEMPRKPLKFLAMIAEAEKRRGALAVVAERKAKSRAKYRRQYERHF
jgi:hypothetical protein